MKVKDLMNKNIFTVNINTPLKDFAEKILAENRNCIIVTKENKKVVGIITFLDLLRFLFPDHKEIYEHDEYLSDVISLEQRIYQKVNMPAEALMTKFPETINSESLAVEAAAIMKEFKIKQLPVVDNELLVGVISFKNILKSFINKMKILNY